MVIKRHPMPKLVQVTCLTCGTPFLARKADIDRGWGKFHSKSCKAVYQSRKKTPNKVKKAAKQPVPRSSFDEYDAICAAEDAKLKHK